MAWMLAFVVAGLTAAEPTHDFDLDGPGAEASAQGRAFATLGPVPFADLQVEGRGEATLQVQQRIEAVQATYGDLARFHATAAFGVQHVEVELIEAGLPPALRNELSLAPPGDIEGGVAFDQTLYGSWVGLGSYATPVQAAISVWGVGRVSLNGHVLTERALVHVTALSASAHTDDASFQQLSEARPGDLEIGVLALGVPELGFVQLGFDRDVQIAIAGEPVQQATTAELEAGMPYRSLDRSAQVAQNEAQGVPDPGPTTQGPHWIPPNALERSVLDANLVGLEPGTLGGAAPGPEGVSDQQVEIATSAEELVAEAEGVDSDVQPPVPPALAPPEIAQSERGTARRPLPSIPDPEARRLPEGAVSDVTPDVNPEEATRPGATDGTDRTEAEQVVPTVELPADQDSGRIAGIPPANTEVQEDDVQVRLEIEPIPPANAVSAQRGVPVLNSGISPANAGTPDSTGVRVLQGDATPPTPARFGPGRGIPPLQSGNEALTSLGAGSTDLEINNGATRSTVTFGPGARGGSSFGPGASVAGGATRSVTTAPSAGTETTTTLGSNVTGTGGTGFVSGITPLNSTPATPLPQGIQPMNAQPAAPTR